MALRVVFMGTPAFSVPALEEIVAAGHDVAAVYSQPPRPAGRGMAPRKSPVHVAAEAAGIEVRTPASLKGASDQEAFAALRADVAVVVAYGLILPKPILDAPRFGCLNIHASALLTQVHRHAEDVDGFRGVHQAAAAWSIRLKRRPMKTSKMLRRYKTSKGPITRLIFTGSMVGVMSAAATAAPTMATRH